MDRSVPEKKVSDNRLAMSKASQINNWLITEGRLLKDDKAIIAAFAQKMIDAGVPITRFSVAERFANPLLVAMLVSWTEKGIQSRPIPRSMLSSNAYWGSPFEFVQNHRKMLRKRLDNLNLDTEHSIYVEQATVGATEYIAQALEFSDGSIHSCSFSTAQPGGFTDEQAATIDETRHGLACALEPANLRRSMSSLLQAYLGKGPASAIISGSIERGSHAVREAVVMISDLRQFTWMSENWTEKEVLAALDAYFEAIVDAVRGQGGDVLKFMGDGVLSAFVIDDDNPKTQQAERSLLAAQDAHIALKEVNIARSRNNLPELTIGCGIDVGEVTYGNIGSPERLDFTVLGRAVNTASRVQELCKSLKDPTLVTSNIAELCPERCRSLGPFKIRGLSQPVEIFAVDDGG